MQVAVLLLPLPERAMLEQIETPASVKFTEPVGAFPVTVAVNVTELPTIDGLDELTSEVEDVALMKVAEQLAVDPPLEPAQLQLYVVPDKPTAEDVPVVHNPVVGAEEKLPPFEEPQTPLTGALFTV